MHAGNGLEISTSTCGRGKKRVLDLKSDWRKERKEEKVNEHS